MLELLLQALAETALMVGLATLATVLFGIPLGVILFNTAQSGLAPQRRLNLTLSFVVNAARSLPYIILVIALIPITRLVVGSSIGTLAATFSLSIAGIMLYCRMVEEALRNVPHGLTEAAQAMGANRFQIITKVLLPEALPQLIAALTLIIISLIGFSAMAGIVGGGGLGDLANRYGYQRYNTQVIIQVVIILIIIVQAIQSLGDFLVKKLSP